MYFIRFRKTYSLQILFLKFPFKIPIPKKIVLENFRKR